MSLFGIAWRSLKQRWLASTLTGFSMALGVMLVFTTLIALSVISEYFQRNMELNYNLVVGPKGGKLQLVLNTVYHLSAPVENLPYRVYQDMLPAGHRHARRENGQPVGGKYAPYVQHAIPYCLGDNYQGFRSVGTVPELFELPFAEGRRYEFSAGKNFDAGDFFAAIIGAAVARETGLGVGDTFQPTHGITESEDGKEHEPFHIVGVLAPTGTPNDRALFVNMEGFYLLENHALPPPDEVEAKNASAADGSSAEEAETVAQGQAADDESGNNGHAHDHGDPADDHKPLPVAQREVTAILVRTQENFLGLGFQNAVNEGELAQAVAPIGVISEMMDYYVLPFQWLLIGLTTLIVLVSAMSILVSIYNSMSERKRDIAVMRALGARRSTVMQIILLESIILSLLAGTAGWLMAQFFILAINPLIVQYSGVSAGLFEFVSLGPLVSQVSREQVPGWLNLLPVEALLLPILVGLAALVGYLPARHAYQTDVAEALSRTP